MTALSAARATPLREGRVVNARVGASTTIHQGGLLEIAATGYVTAAGKGADKSYWGIARESAKTGASESAVIEAEHGVTAHFKGDGTLDTDAEKLAALGDKAYVIDDQTVSTTSTTATSCGTIVDFDDDGVWVKLDR